MAIFSTRILWVAIAAMAVGAVAPSSRADTVRSTPLAANAKKDPYFLFAVKHFGTPVATRVRSITHSEGKTYGAIEFHFRNGVELDDETMPPETFRVSMIRSAGLPDAAELLRFAAQDAKQRGYSIDFKHATRSHKDHGVTTEEHWDPTDGVNAAVDLSYHSGKLVGVAIHGAS